MRISEILKSREPHISFEIFPPKTDAGFESVIRAADQIAELRPSYISVTYGAGGGTSKNTVKIASHIKHDKNVTSLAHLTCVSSTKDMVHKVIDELKEQGIENVLALRGDIPQDSEFPLPNHYRYASELIEDIRSRGDFCIGAACYPEGHVETEHKADDILNLKHKVDCGVDFLTTQMFFDNSILYNFLYRIREKGITVPVVPGIMPVTSAKQIKRIGFLSGTMLPQRFLAVVDRFGDDPEAMKQAGIAYATDQIIDLFANGVNHVHVYSMNKPEVAQKIKEAREQGDLSENAEYDAAKDEQRDIEARIEELEKILKNAEVVVEDEIDLDKINVGCRVTVYDFEYEEELEFSIVGSTEANSLAFKISNESPVGRALMGKQKGDVVKVELPDGEVEYKVLNITRG